MNTTKKSLKDRIREYLIKNINYIVPGILMLGGSIYYPEIIYKSITNHSSTAVSGSEALQYECLHSLAA